ncbi:MAG: 4Fe-4S binding protein [candidate division WOR-3 bacterium]
MRQPLLTKTRVVWFVGFASFAALVFVLFWWLGGLTPVQVFLYGWLPTVLVGLYVAFQAGRVERRRRWFAFGALALAGTLVSLWLILHQGLLWWRVLVHGLIPLLLFALAAVFAGNRVAPYRLVQIFSFVALNGYFLAYVHNSVLFSGFLKRIPQPVLNCYGGPLAFFACPIGSFQQMLGQPNPAVASFFERLAAGTSGFMVSLGRALSHVPFLPLGVFVLVGAIVGRAACAWVCPFGLWQDLLYKIRVGARAGWRRFLTLAVIGALGLYVVLLLKWFLGLALWKLLFFGWVPFMSAILCVVVRGKTDLPKRLSLGGWLVGIALGAVVWFKFDPSFGVVVGVLGMTLFGLSGGWYALMLSVPAVFFAVVLGPLEFSVGSLAGSELGLVLAMLVAAVVVLLDLVVRVRLPARLLKYAFLLVVCGFVAYKTAEPWFCKLCPQGTLGAGIPLVLWDPLNALRGMVGWLFYLKVAVLLVVLLAAMAVKRPFCRLVCPIGAVYSVFNKASLLHMRLDRTSCTGCGLCRKVCPMDIEPQDGTNQLECIRCGECAWKCPKGSLKFTV